MMKFVFALCVAVALMHQTQAFKVITIQQAPVQSTAPAIDPTALIQTVQSSITSKLQQVQALVGSLLQQKLALKQNALNSLQSTMASVKSQAAAIRPVVIRKQIYIGKPVIATTTSTADVATTTTSG